MDKPSVVITGGAGYIGSACTSALINEGYEVTVIDNLCRGSDQYVDKRADFIQTDILETDRLKDIFQQKNYTALLHLAAHSSVAESMTDPEKYAENVRGTASVLEAMRASGISKILFSSTAVVYGVPHTLPLTEDHPLDPVNTYGQSKLQSEQLIQDWAELHQGQYIIFRYFNVVGDAGLGYRHPEANNLFPAVLEVVEGKRAHLSIFGDDYHTPDGTGVRDYIDVRDIANAHVQGLKHQDSEILNLSTGKGTSVKQVVDAFSRQWGQAIPTQVKERRRGDIDQFYASAEKAHRLLGWKPDHDLSDMVNSCLQSLLQTSA